MFIGLNGVQELAASYPANPLIQRRGQPSTHDVSLATDVLARLRRCEQVKLPSYDKAAFHGQGDQAPCEQWRVVNAPDEPKVRIVLLEGWCIGFKALSDGELRRRWESAKAQEGAGVYDGRLAFASLCNISVVNAALKQYDEITKQLDAMIHIDTADLKLVYQWRLEQEQALRKCRGTGMTDEQLITFIDGYYPSYELYTEDMRAGVMKRPAEQLRLIIGEDRKVQEVLQM
ncbi:MAG: hypothetical protein OHK93_008085 [Ramalina farinacea]|uniref:Uncharacterized protein n=1 Tax=Ramalina farinacea TaxID=258253 RepID=A0AA43QNW5_9LECA|nr:hypothetical protein [Ramalina farinacea]